LPSSAVSLIISWLLIAQPIAAFTMDAPGDDHTSVTLDQRAVQVLSRLTFGARLGDLDAIKKIGVQAYIDQQLSPDSIDDSALQKRLEKLPTLSLSSPTLAEVYNPPKPAPTPSPAAAKVEQTTASGSIMPEPTTTPVV